jgi:GT2 family glycosyltransferase
VTARVTAVILAYGDEQWLERSVASVLKCVDVDVDVLVVDNGCTSPAVDAVRDLPAVTVLRPPVNLGYAGGCNFAAAAATGDYLAFVNSDAEVAPDALARLVAVVDEPAVGLAMGSIRLADDPETINTAGNPLTYFGMSWAGGCHEPAERYPVRRHVTCGSGCCFVIHRHTWQALGGFPDEYFAYHEDSELSLRLWQRGHTVEYVPDAVVLHHYEFSRNPIKWYLVERNRLVLLLTTYQRRSLLLVAPMLAVTEAAMLASALAGGWCASKLRGYGWVWRNRRWVRARRAQLQRERTESDHDLAALYTAEFAARNMPAPPGVGVFNTVSRAYWALIRGLLPRHV